jgi:hypothetical protein
MGLAALSQSPRRQLPADMLVRCAIPATKIDHEYQLGISLAFAELDNENCVYAG